MQSLMRESLVLLDVPGRSLATVAAVIAERLVHERVLDVETSAKMVRALLLHSSAAGTATPSPFGTINFSRISCTISHSHPQPHTRRVLFGATRYFVPMLIRVPICA